MRARRRRFLAGSVQPFLSTFEQDFEMRGPLLLVLITSALAGCASTSAPPGPDVTQAVGDRFAGRPVQEMLARYGAPLRTKPLGGETIYSWEVRDVLYFSSGPLPVQCQLDAYVTEQLVVRTVGVVGKAGACPRFMP